MNDSPVIRIGERNKQPGLGYAVTDDGLELPVIDLTHPAFGRDSDQAAQELAIREYLDTMARQARLPVVVRNALTWMASRNSRLMRAIRDSGHGYLSGLDTYLLKLGPENLGAGYAGRLDRMVASSLPAVSARLRLRNTASLMAEALLPRLQARRDRPLRMLNIAGGPAMDSINALLLLRRGHAALLENRPVHIHVLDVDHTGAGFGERALRALRVESGPLGKVDVRFEHRRYDWRHAEALGELAGDWDLAHATVCSSSEGGLFEYGDDEAILANLEAVRQLGSEGTFMVGSVTKDGPLARAVRDSGLRQTTHLRSPEGFADLVAKVGWTVGRMIDNLMTFEVELEPAPGRPTARVPDSRSKEE